MNELVYSGIILPSGTELYHFSHVMLADSREAAALFLETQDNAWQVDINTGRLFFWLDWAKHLESTRCNTFDNAQLYQLNANRGQANAAYVGNTTCITTRDLWLYDFMRLNEKETFADAITGTRNANFKERIVQNQMRDNMEPRGFDGWISTHDRSDPNLEVCLFNCANKVEFFPRLFGDLEYISYGCARMLVNYKVASYLVEALNIQYTLIYIHTEY